MKTNYTDEEILALIELQLGKPPVTKPTRLGRPPRDSGEGKYYNEVTEWLFRMLGHDEEGILIRMRRLREQHYRKHDIVAVDLAATNDMDLFMTRRADGSVEFNSTNFDNTKMKR